MGWTRPWLLVAHAYTAKERRRERRTATKEIGSELNGGRREPEDEKDGTERAGTFQILRTVLKFISCTTIFHTVQRANDVSLDPSWSVEFVHKFPGFISAPDSITTIWRGSLDAAAIPRDIRHLQYQRHMHPYRMFHYSSFIWAM